MSFTALFIGTNAIEVTLAGGCGGGKGKHRIVERDNTSLRCCANVGKQGKDTRGCSVITRGEGKSGRTGDGWTHQEDVHQ